MTQIIVQTLFSIIMLASIVILFISTEMRQLKKGRETFTFIKMLNSFFMRKNILQNAYW